MVAAASSACPFADDAEAWARGDFTCEDTQAIRVAVQIVQHGTEEIKRQAAALTAVAASIPDIKSRAAEAEQKSKAAARDARQFLRSFSEVSRPHGIRSRLGPGHIMPQQDQIMRRLTQQKLDENLTVAEKSLDDAWLIFKRVVQERELQAAPAASRGRSIVTLPNMDETQSQGSPADGSERYSEEVLNVRSEQQLQLQLLDNSQQATVELHTTIALEYAEQVTTLHRDIVGLQQCVVDLASLTHEQGSVLDDIEANMGEVVEKSQGAVEQLAVTGKAQQKRSKCILRLLVFAMVAASASVMAVARKSLEA